MKKQLLWALCPRCENYIIPKISVVLSGNHKSSKLEDSDYERFMLYQPDYLRNNYNTALLKEFGLKLDLETFRNKYNSLFWSSIWYFSVLGLPFDLFLPYQPKVESPFARSKDKRGTVISFDNLEINQNISFNYRKDSKYSGIDESKYIDESIVDHSCINTNFVEFLSTEKSKSSLLITNLSINGLETSRQTIERAKDRESRHKSMDLPNFNTIT
jgi:hypothetical protein